jgi:hypothetical protein
MKPYQRSLLILATTCLLFVTLFISFSEAQNRRKSNAPAGATRRSTSSKRSPSTEDKLRLERLMQSQKGRPIRTPGQADIGSATVSEAVAFAISPAVRDLITRPVTPEEAEKMRERVEFEKNEANTRQFRSIDFSKTGNFTDPTLSSPKGRSIITNAVTSPIQNFDGPDADTGAPLFGSRFIPPDTNAAVGPNHVVVMTNMGLTIYDKAGNVLKPQFRFSQLLVGIPNASDDDGDPIVLYDQLADRWILSQFNLTLTGNSTHEHIQRCEPHERRLTHNAADRRLNASFNNNLKRGSGAFQFIPGHVTYTITDRSTANDTFVCPP